MEIFLLILLIAAIILAPLVPLWIECLHKPKKIYVVTWRYDAFCHAQRELVQAKDPYTAWHKVKKQHAIPIDLMEIEEYVEVL